MKDKHFKEYAKNSLMSYGEWYKYHTAIREEGKGKHK